MAEQGVVLDIDAKFLDNLKKADKALSNSAKQANNLTKAFQKTLTGSGGFATTMQQIYAGLSKIGGVDFSTGVAKLNTHARTSADAVNLLTTNVAKLKSEYAEMASAWGGNKTKGTHLRITSEGDMENIAKLRSAISQINNTLNNKKRKKALSLVDIESLNRQKDLYKRALSELTMSDSRRTDMVVRETNKRIREAQREAKATQEAAASKYTKSPASAISYANQAKSINEMAQAIKYLETVRDRINSKTKSGAKDIERINSLIGETRTRMDGLRGRISHTREEIAKMNQATDRFKSLLAAAFSISAIRGYVNQIIKVRGEFELQQRALQAILQNRDEANKLWNQTVQLAVKSPFQVKELVTYTKQLAAYRVETEKLHDTTKMLADISAGLGVDMGRLILAFGQVKAANYLRGTELRQFSEAGINILDELARYYTAVEGKAVTVGEVFERVSKRMVSFADVETVLKNVTSAGGMFYQMQEIQAETLKGSISNLKDQLDLMLNDIGKSNEGILKGSVQVASWLIKHYKAFLPVLSMVAIGFTAMNISMLKVKLGARALTMGMKSLKSAMLSPWTLIIAALSEVAVFISRYIYSIKQIGKEHDRLEASIQDVSIAFNDAFSAENIKNARVELQNLIKLAKNDFSFDFGLSQEEINKLDLSTLEQKFIELRDKLFDANAISDAMEKAFVNSTSFDNLFTRIISAASGNYEGLKMGKGLKGNLQEVDAEAEALIETLRKEARILSAELNLPSDHALRRPQQKDESRLQYLRRLISAYQGLGDEMQDMEYDASRVTREIDNFDKVLGNATEEGKKFMSQFAADIEGMSFDEASAQIKIGIDKTAMNNSWTDFQKEVLYRSANMTLPVLVRPTFTTSLNGESTDINADDDGDGTPSKDTRWQDLLRTIKEVNQAYKDLNKTFDATEAKQGAIEKYTEALNDVLSKVAINGEKLDASQFMEMFDLTTEGGMLAALDMIAKEAPDAADKLKAKLEKGEITWEVKVKTKEDTDKELTNYMEQLFSGYELSLELDKLNIPPSFAREFFNLEATSLDELRNKLTARKGEFSGTEMEKEYEKYIKKVDEMENKAQQERLKTYLQYARDAIGERAKIKLEEVKKLQEIELAFGSMDSEAKQAATTKVREDSYQATKKFDWEEFQKSDMFVSMFESLDSASTQLTEHMIEKLRDFKDEWRDMPLEDMRSIVDKINQLESHLVEANPFAKGRELRDKVRLDGRTEADIQAENIAESEKIEAYDAEIANLETILRLKEETKVVEALQYAGSVDMADMSALSVSELRKEIEARKEARRLSADTIANNDEALRDQEMLRKAYAKQAEYLQDGQKMANDLYDAFSELMDILGGGDSPGAMFAQMGMDMANSVINCFALQLQLKATTVEAHTFGAAMNTAMGIVGWIVMGVQVISAALKAIFAAHDNRLERQIVTIREQVEVLSKSLEHLEECLDNAFTTQQLTSYTEAVQKNIDAQIAAYEQMIALEEDKKKTDDDKIKEWREKQEELREAIKETYKESFSTASAGILDDMLSAADSFVEAWHEAFLETGDGLSGLEQEFRDMLSNIVKRQAALQIVGEYTNMYSDWLKDYLNVEAEDMTLTTEEARAWADRVNATLPELSGLLESFFSGADDLLQSQGELSELSKGIQGVSESTAQALEALLNSMRFYVADSNIRLRNIESAFANDDIANNPLLNELRQQTALIRSIEEMFSSVIGRGDSSHSGAYLKVLM